MSEDEFTTLTTPMLRHGITMLAGGMAAWGWTHAGSEVAAYALSAAGFAAALAWSVIEKSRVAAALVGAVPVSEVESLATTIGQFRSQGASPILVVHLAQTLAAVAGEEFNAFQREQLAAQQSLGNQVATRQGPTVHPEVVEPGRAPPEGSPGPFQPQPVAV